ncbi:MAG: hypothetical protein JWN48_2769 [Myxococcaceae bacterium]|nr:hypothetical protein [Myxococcaceae bacterium]
MTASDAESWARLRLVEGESSAKKWELVSSLGHTTLTVGSNSDCTWVVRGEAVRPIHFSLHWDGTRLRVADVYSAGDVRVDGAELSSQWRPLSGRVRIEFGRAAMVVETSAVPSDQPPRSAEHPLEGLVGNTAPSLPIGVGATSAAAPGESPVARDARRGSSGPPRNIGKGTLIGVAPQTLIEAKLLENYQPQSVTSELPDGVSAKDARRAERARLERERAERERAERISMKATLVGGIGVGPTPTPIASRQQLRPTEDVKPPESGRPADPRTGPAANATLMGFNMAEALRGVVNTPSVPVGRAGPSERVSGASLSEPDQRTTQGFPQDAKPPRSQHPLNITIGPAGRRMTQKGMVSQPPGVDRDAVAHAPVRSVSAAPGGDRTERIGSAWQELPEEPRVNRTLRGVQEHEPEGDFRAPRLGAASEWGREERFSDIPTQMRDPASFESRRPSRGFPWRYVGVLVLTGVAYFAWLYLLDHM